MVRKSENLMIETMQQEVHPPFLGARLVRALRALRRVRGWERFSAVLVPWDRAAAFVVQNRSGLFAGDLSSWIDRQMYLVGAYEEDAIRQFISILPSDRRGTVLDVGANVGTHSLAFARHFKKVHAFEPNPQLWQNFQRNLSLNRLTNVQLHKLGLGDAEAELPFYMTSKANYGLGTFAQAEQYDVPLKEIGKLKVVVGDEYLKAAQIGAVDAIKIDVQGFEVEVVRGLARVLETNRPFVWLEVGPDTVTKFESSRSLSGLVSYPCRINRLEHRIRGLFHSTQWVPMSDGWIGPSDYMIVPIDRD
jgi:FkbM family methyltransferase